MRNNIILVIKGFFMGIANIIPGVSGGTIALIMGIYEDFIGAISHFFSNFKKNMKFLLPIVIGMALAILSMSNIIGHSYDNYPIPTTLFFVGLVIGGVPMIWKRVKKSDDRKKVSSYIIALITFTLVIVLASSELIFDITREVSLANINISGYLLLFIVGVIASATMIVPGISGSLTLMVLGYYYPILQIVKDLTKFKDIGSNILLAGTFGMGILIGIVAISKLIEFLLKKYEGKTFFGVLGFILASVVALPMSTYLEVENLSITFPQVIIGFIFCLIGMAISYKLGEK